MSKQEINKKIAEAKQRMGQGNLSNEEFMKKIMKQLPAQSIGAKTSGGQEIPPLNISAMTKLPKHILNAEELKTHITLIKQKLEKAMSADQLESVAEIMGKCENDAKKMGNTGVLVFYKGASKEGVLLVTRATLNNMKDSVNMANLGGLLTTGGEPVSAIPILKYLLKKQPENTIILNNLGQAFVKLGAKDSAMVYLNKCLNKDAKFARANSTAAYIQKAQGNTAKATALVKESLKYEPTEAAELLAEKLGVKVKPDFTATTKSIPNYFDMYKFKLPRLQKTTSEYVEVVSAQKSYLASLSELEDNLRDLYNTAQEKGTTEGQIDKIKSMTAVNPIKARAMKMLMAEYSNPDNIMYSSKERTDYLQSLKSQKDQLSADLNVLAKNYDYQVKLVTDKMGEGSPDTSPRLKSLLKAHCYQQNKRNDQYLAKCSEFTEQYNRKILHFAREQYHFQRKWHYLAALNDQLADAAYYKAALTYIGSVKSLYDFATADDGCSNDTITVKRVKIENPFERVCPIDVSITIGIGELKMNCKSAALGATFMGVKMKYSDDYVKKESTIEIGLGISPVGVGAGPLNGGVELSHVLYITVDGKGEISDWGMKQTIEGSAGIEVGNTEIGAEVSLSSTMSVVSGYEGEISVPKGLFTIN